MTKKRKVATALKITTFKLKGYTCEALIAANQISYRSEHTTAYPR